MDIPYFPAAFSIGEKEPMRFNFGLRVLDCLQLPCPIRGCWSDGPVKFGSVHEAVQYLETELDLWREEHAGRKSSPPAEIDKETLFRSEGIDLRHQLSCGDPLLDAHVNRVRLDRYVCIPLNRS